MKYSRKLLALSIFTALTITACSSNETEIGVETVQETVQTVGETIAETDTVVTSNALQDEDINVDDRTEDLSEEIILDGIWLFDHIRKRCCVK